MTFHINQNLTINEIAGLAALAKNTPMADRVGNLQVSAFRVAEDRQRDAFMFETGALARETGVQNHYLLYFIGQWFDVRNKNRFSNEVSFYNDPADRGADRNLVEQCFGQAARIYGKSGYDDATIFNPVFCPDDWHPGYI